MILTNLWWSSSKIYKKQNELDTVGKKGRTYVQWIPTYEYTSVGRPAKADKFSSVQTLDALLRMSQKQ